MPDFEDHLWWYLLANGADPAAVYQTPAQRRHRPSLLLSGILITVTLIAVTVVLALTATNATAPAFAVTDNHDGTVTLTIREVADLAAVNRRLSQVGVRARLVPFRQDCPAVLSLPVGDLQPSTQPWSTDNTSTGAVGSWTVGIIPSRIPARHTLVFALQEWNHKGWEMASGFVKGPGPRCAAPQDLTILSR